MLFKGSFSIGSLLLAVFLILYGLIALGTISIPSTVMGILALVSGIFLLFGK